MKINVLIFKFIYRHNQISRETGYPSPTDLTHILTDVSYVIYWSGDVPIEVCSFHLSTHTKT